MTDDQQAVALLRQELINLAGVPMTASTKRKKPSRPPRPAPVRCDVCIPTNITVYGPSVPGGITLEADCANCDACLETVVFPRDWVEV